MQCRKRARTEQAETIVNVEIAATVGKQFRHPGDLGAVFGNMRLQVQVRVFGQQPPAGFELLRAAAGREARRYRVMSARPFKCQRDINSVAVAHSSTPRYRSSSGRRVAIHHDLAGDQAQVEPLGLVEDRIHRLRMHGGEYRAGGGAVAQHLRGRKTAISVGVIALGKFKPRWGRCTFEPVEQLVPWLAIISLCG